MTDNDAMLAQLQQQQAIFTQIIKAQLEGRWSQGADTAEGLLYALDPNMAGTLTLDTPVVHSEEDNPPKA